MALTFSKKLNTLLVSSPAQSIEAEGLTRVTILPITQVCVTPTVRKVPITILGKVAFSS